MNQPEHSKIINKIAKQYFQPRNITQKGKSRTWIYDSKWWICIIEFQPSDWDKGTYLNVGVCWLWNKKDYISYDYAIDHNSRIEAFAKYENEESFGLIISEMCKRACELVEKYKTIFNNIAITTKNINQYGNKMIWDKFHCGISNGIIKNILISKKYFEEILKMEIHFEWERDLHNRVKILIELINANKFEEYIISEIIETRKMLKLKEVDIDYNIFA